MPSAGTITSSPSRKAGEESVLFRSCHQTSTWMSGVMKTGCVSLPGVKKPVGQYGPPGVANTTSAAKDDDEDEDIDLFGSDDEVSSLEWWNPCLLPILTLLLSGGWRGCQDKRTTSGRICCKKSQEWVRDHFINIVTVPLPVMGWLPMMIHFHHLSADCLMDTRSSERVLEFPSGHLPASLW